MYVLGFILILAPYVYFLQFSQYHNFVFSIGAYDDYMYAPLQFGSYRVETVVNLFNRIVDLHNFEVVLAVLTPYEVACVQCRIGACYMYFYF